MTCITCYVLHVKRWENFALCTEKCSEITDGIKRIIARFNISNSDVLFWRTLHPFSKIFFSIFGQGYALWSLKILASYLKYFSLHRLTFEYRDVGPNRRKYRNLTCLILLNYNAGFWRKSRSFSEIFSESLTKGMGHYPSKFQPHSANILSVGDFLKKCGTSPPPPINA